MQATRKKNSWSGALLVLALGVMTFTQAYAEDSMAAATPTPMASWNALFQTQANVTGNGSNLNLSLTHVRVKGTFSLDAENLFVVMPDYGPTAFTLLDAYGVHQFSDVKGLSVMAGQFKVPFGDNRFLTPSQLKRTTYNAIDALIPGGATAKAWDLGMGVKEKMEDFTIEADAIQGAGPNVTVDANNTIDYAAKAEWKTSDFVLGLSDYYGEGGQGAGYIYTSFQNWFGAHGRLTLDNWDLRGEAIFAPNSANGYNGQLSVKALSWFEPLVWYETILTNNAATTNNLGAGVNLWAGAKTRISLDVSFIGLNDILASNTETVQFEEVF